MRLEIWRKGDDAEEQGNIRITSPRFA